MEPHEEFASEIKKINTAGREFPVRFYIHPQGYNRNGKPILCFECQIKPSTYRAEIYNHLYEPQGSEFYCQACVPQTNERTSE